MKRIAGLALTGLALTVMVACRAPMDPARQAKMAELQARLDAEFAENAAYTREEVLAKISNKTLLHFDPGHGTQIEYTSAVGKAYLWYPGNSVVLPGDWKIESRMANRNGQAYAIQTVCFRYGENTYNPMTGDKGAVWQCSPAGEVFRDAVASRDGDYLSLGETQRAPYRLDKWRVDFEALLAEAGPQKYTPRRWGPVWFPWAAAQPDQYSEERALALVSGHTSYTILRFGSLVEYFGADGKYARWRTGRDDVRHGDWKISTRVVEADRSGAIQRREVASLCTRYPDDWFDFESGTWSRETSEWRCEATAIFRSAQVDSKKGDIFGLAGRTEAPFPLPLVPMSLDDLVAKMPKGKTAAMLPEGAYRHP